MHTQTMMGPSMQGRGNRIAKAMLLCCLLALSAALIALSCPRASYAEEADEQATPAGEVVAQSDSGTFALAVANAAGTGYIVEPCSISYTSGQTVEEALSASNYGFVFSSSHFLESVKGIAGGGAFLSYSYICTGGTGTLNQYKAANTKAVFITANSIGGDLGDNHCLLLAQMVAYKEATNGVSGYSAAAAAYSNAYSGLYSSSNSAAGTLYTKLKQSMDLYAQMISGQKYTTNFSIAQGASTVSDATIVVTDAYGNKTTTTGTSASVIAGDCSYEVISADKKDAVKGTFKSSKANDGQTIATELPSDNWFATVNLDDAAQSYSNLPAERSSDYRTVVYTVPDTAHGTGSIYVYAWHSSAITSDTVSGYRFAAVYTGTDGKAYDFSIGWESNAYAPTNLVDYGIAGNACTFEIRHSATVGSNAVTQIERCTATIRRNPTLKALSVKGDGLEHISSFNPYAENYSINTLSNSLSITPAAYGTAAQGYSVTVDGVAVADGGSATVDLSGATTKTIGIKVSLANGQSKTYTITANKMTAVTTTLAHDAGVEAKLYNAAGSEITPVSTSDTSSTYSTIPGDTYTYVGTKSTYYHVTNTFVAASGQSIAVPTPQTEDWLSGIVMAYNGYYDADSCYGKDASSTAHDISWVVPDTYTTTMLKATSAASSGNYTYKVNYTSQVDGSSQTSQLGSFSSSTSGGETGAKGSVNNFARKGGYGNTTTLVVASTTTGSSGETYYQDYSLKIRRELTLSKLSAADSDGDLVMTQTATASSDSPTTGFNNLVADYTVGVPAGTSSIDVAFSFQAPSAATDVVAGGYSATIGDASFAYDAENPTQLNTQTISLDATKSLQVITVQLAHPDSTAIDTAYTITVNQLPEDSVTITPTPADATVTVIEDLSKNRIWPGADGTYKLIDGYSYTWTVAASGYVGKSGSFTASAGYSLDVSLDKAEPNTTLDTTLQAAWPYFRADSNNNCVTDAPTPTTSNKAVLYWANALGEGYSSGAAGCPILVDGYLYSYGGAAGVGRIYKVDTVTGKTVAEATMVGTSSFAITPMTYAQGMVFVALSNGRIEAFDAKTLESLWVYTDPNGGQPNCPITYCDGCIYTGFWNFSNKTDFVCLTITDEHPSLPGHTYNSKTATTTVADAKVALWSYAQKGGFYWAGAYACSTFVLEGSDSPLIGDVLGIDEEGKASGPLISFDPKTGKILDTLTDYKDSDGNAVKVGNIKSTVCYDTVTDRYYFTTRGGYFVSVKMNANGTIDHDSVKALKLDNGRTDGIVSSTSTPVVCNGRAYVGADNGSYGAYNGQCIDVIDLATFKVAYRVNAEGRPQTSGLLTTAYAGDDGTAYIYFFDNYTPGKLRVIKDKPGQTKPDVSSVHTETYTDTSGVVQSVSDTANVIFCPVGAQAQYCICSPIVDEYGTIYFKNDSAYMMAVGSTIDKIEVTSQPTKTTYGVGDTFDPSGMTVVATYSNGKTRDITQYVTYSTDPLTANDTEVTIKFPYTMYQNDTDATDVSSYSCPSTSVTIRVLASVAATVSTSTLPDATIDAAYSATLVAQGSPRTYTWSLASGSSLPAGLSLSSDGVISGTPTKGGLSTFTVQVTNGISPAGTRVLSIGVKEAPSITASGTTPFSATAGSVFSMKLVASGYPASTWSITNGSLPAGLSLDAATGVISGTPAAGGSYSFTAQADNGIEPKSWKVFTIVVNQMPKITTSSLDNAAVGSAYSYVLAADGWPKPTWSIVSGSLPAGLSLDSSTGTISGTATSAGASTVAVKATNSLGSDTKTFTLNAMNTDISKAVVEPIADQPYTALAIMPDPVVTLDGVKLVKDTDYTIAYSDAAGTSVDAPTAIGTYTITITGKGTYTGFKQVHFNITGKASISGATITGIASSYAYTGSAIAPKPSSVSIGNTALAEGVDYAVGYVDSLGVSVASPRNAGSYKVVLTGMGNYAGTAEAPFQITPLAAQLSWSGDTGLVYDGAAKSLAASVSNLVSGDDCTVVVTDGNKVDAGSYAAMATLAGKDAANYVLEESSKSHAYTIAPASISKAVISGLSAKYAATGSAIEPAVSVTIGGTGLVEGTDYVVSYIGASSSTTTPVSAGAYKIVVTGIGNYDPATSTSASFNVVPALYLFAGDGRYETAAKIVSAEVAGATPAGVIVASGFNFPDALSASGLSGLLGYPIVLTDPEELSPASAASLAAIKAAKGSRLDIIVIGGSAAINDAVVADMQRNYGDVTRLYGDSRYETAQKVYEYGASRHNVATGGTGWNTDEAIVATGANFADALAISPYAAHVAAPVLLVDGGGSSLDSWAADALGSSKGAVILGGTAAVNSAVERSVRSACSHGGVERLNGDSRYETCIKVVSWELAHGMSLEKGIGFATGKNFPDALASGPLLGSRSSVLVLMDPEDDNSTALSFLKANHTDVAEVFGGTGAVSDATRNAIASSLGWGGSEMTISE